MPWPLTAQLSTMHSYYFQTKVVQNVGFLLCRMAKIYDLLDGSLEKRKVRGLIPCFGQDGYQVQEP